MLEVSGAESFSRVQARIFAAAAGLSVANVYAAQPLLDAIARDFHMTAAKAGLIVTLTQIGYGLGLLFLVPLGDLVDRRRLLLAQGVLSITALLAIATARTPVTLFMSLAAMGLLAVMVQVLVAFAATLAAPAERGRMVGTVTSGVVIGILVARFAAGMIEDLGGWRAVYATSALLMFAILGLLVRTLPRDASAKSNDGYLRTVLSIPILFWRDPVLFGRGLLALMIFASFSTFWTALVLPLSAPPFSFSHAQIGLFGLVGMAGVLAANGAGRMADLGRERITTGISLVILLVAWLPIAMLPESMALLAVGVIALDLAVQAVHVSNQSVLLSRCSNAAGRLVGGYMVFYSIGSATGAIASTNAYAVAGWSGVCLTGAGFSGTALLGWIACGRRNSRETYRARDGPN